MDIAKLDTRKLAEQGFDLTIVDPNGDKTEIVITVRGADSVTYREKFTELRRRANNQINKTHKIVRSVGEQDADNLELLVAATVTWRGIEMDGSPLVYSEQNARQLYTDFPAIGEQVDRAINDRSNFLPKAATR